MDRRCIWVFMVILVVDSVLSQVNVDGFMGEQVLLPCIYNDTVVENVNIFWKDKNEKGVFDVVGSVSDTSSQDPAFRNRAHVFSSEYRKGNFSLLLKNLRVSDSGRYSCFIAGANARCDVLLRVTDKPLTRDPEPPSTTPAGGSNASRGEQSLSLVVLPLLLILIPK